MTPDLSPAAALSQAVGEARPLAPEHISDVARALLLLARELWVVKDRAAVLEAVLAERGIDVMQAVRDYQPAGALAESLKADRDRIAGELIAALMGRAA